LGKRGKIFVNYRRGDVPGDARGVCDRLERAFGKANVFMDVDRLLAGQRFDRELDKALSQCNVLIAVIGPRWMESLSTHAREGDRDFVRDEIAAALSRDIVVIPVLIGRQGYMPSLPRKDDLPEDIRDLVLYQKHDIAHESFNRDADHLTAAIQSVLGGGPRVVPWRAIAISGATGLTLIAALLGYRMDLIPWVGPSAVQPSVAQLNSSTDRAEEASKKAAEAKRQAEADAAKKKAEEEEAAADKKAMADCDRLAASPYDSTRPSGVTPVDFGSIDTVAATLACNNAMTRHPEIARFAFQAGRTAYARKDFAKAVDLYRAAIAKGSAAAMVGLGSLYSGGQGVPEDYAEARKLYEKAASLGDALAMNSLGEIYYYGQGVTVDHVEARKWYERAAALGNPDATFSLGYIYDNGNGVKQDYAEARKWYEKAAALGNANAMFGLGLLYHHGSSVTQNYTEARNWYEKAAALGNATAMSNLGLLYANGNGVEQNHTEARKWYEKAAALGRAMAMLNLGIFYENGLGVTKDIKQARNWYQKAADTGSEEAKARLKDLK
jgi:TPR repeat protein